MARVVVIAGMSGAGRSVAAAAFEDSGWFVVDNLPPELIGTIGNMALSAGGDYEKIALVIGGYSEETNTQLNLLKDAVKDFSLIFLEATEETLITRFKTTKRRHPLAGAGSLSSAILEERELLKAARTKADLVIDTSKLTPYQLKDRLNEKVIGSSESESNDIQITLLSFGFKNGLPRDVDVMFDVRFMPNPHWVPELRSLTGQDEVIQEYVMAPEVSQKFFAQLQDMLANLLPAYRQEGKAYLTIAFGCTGGKHRSVSVVELIHKFLEAEGFEHTVRHRDVAK